MISLFNRLVAYIFVLKNRLFSTQIGTKQSEKEPLTKFSIVIIVLLDMLLFGLVYTGIDDQSKVVESPESYASTRCRDTIESFQKIDRPEFQKTVVENLYMESSFNRSKNSYDYGYNYGMKTNDRSLECANIQVLLTKTDSDLALQELYRTRSTLLANITSNENQTNTLRNNYDTKLLEKIAGQDPALTIDPGTAATTKNNLEQLATATAKLEKELSNNTAEILKNSQVVEIINLIKTSGTTVIDTYDQLVFWYPVKIFGVQVLFLIPLLLIVGYWSNYALMKGRPYQLLMASHLMAIL
jgi:hypothetical protein